MFEIQKGVEEPGGPNVGVLSVVREVTGESGKI